MSRRLVAICVGALLTCASCGTSGQSGEPQGGDLPPTTNQSGGGLCSPDVTEGCDPIPADDGDQGDVFPVEQARQEAQGLLGMYERDLPADVRIGRRGDEAMPLTDDYLLGRRTVELDDTDGTGFRVFSVTIELPAGPEVFILTPS